MPRANVDLGTGTIRFSDYDPAGLAGQMAKVGEAWAGAAGQLGQIRMQERRDAAQRDQQFAGAGVYDGPDAGLLRMSQSVSGLRDQAALAQDQAEFHQMRGQFDAAAQRESALNAKLAAQQAVQQRREAARATRSSTFKPADYQIDRSRNVLGPDGVTVAGTDKDVQWDIEKAKKAYYDAIAVGNIDKARAIYDNVPGMATLESFGAMSKPWEAQEAAEDAQVGGADAARELALLRAQRDALLGYRGARSGRDASYFLGSAADRYRGLFAEQAPVAAPEPIAPITMGDTADGVIPVDDTDQGVMTPAAPESASSAPPLIPEDVPAAAPSQPAVSARLNPEAIRNYLRMAALNTDEAWSMLRGPQGKQGFIPVPAEARARYRAEAIKHLHAKGMSTIARGIEQMTPAQQMAALQDEGIQAILAGL